MLFQESILCRVKDVERTLKSMEGSSRRNLSQPFGCVTIGTACHGHVGHLALSRLDVCRFLSAYCITNNGPAIASFEPHLPHLHLAVTSLML